jgi:hypothetical protein
MKEDSLVLKVIFSMLTVARSGRAGILATITSYGGFLYAGGAQVTFDAQCGAFEIVGCLRKLYPNSTIAVWRP